MELSILAVTLKLYNVFKVLIWISPPGISPPVKLSLLKLIRSPQITDHGLSDFSKNIGSLQALQRIVLDFNLYCILTFVCFIVKKLRRDHR